jgi:hypothetical protein
MNKFFEVMKKQKMFAMSALAQQAKSYRTASEIDSYEEDGEVYDKKKLGLRPNDLIFMKHDAPKKFEFGKPFLMSAELSKQHFPLRRLHNWYLIASSLGVTNITFQILGNAFYSGARIGSIEFEDLWLMFHQKWLNMNLLVIWCLQVHAFSFNLLNTLLLYTVLIHFFGMVLYVGCNPWTMRNWGIRARSGFLTRHVSIRQATPSP